MSDVKKIIIADASEEYRGMLADALGDREDMEVVAQTGDGEALLDLVAKHQPQGIIMDLMLTGMDGLEVLEQLGPNRPRSGSCGSGCRRYRPPSGFVNPSKD